MGEGRPRHPNEKRFEDFFEEEKYVRLKNYLYNYRIRKAIVSKSMARGAPRRVLEIGAGLSPMITDRDGVVYSELSFRALKNLRQHQRRGEFVVADCTRLPFADGAFSHVVCSEVIEHVENDVEALRETSRVLAPDGELCLTVPHRKFYFAADDRYVRHFRRYELDEVTEKLSRAGLEPVAVRKVLGPLEKIVMFSTVMAFSLIQRAVPRRRGAGGNWIVALAPIFNAVNVVLMGLARLDAAIMPRALATVLFVRAAKRT